MSAPQKLSQRKSRTGVYWFQLCVAKMVDACDITGAYSGLKILVTGGAGYFGHRLGKALKKYGADVTLFDCRKLMDCEGMTFVQGDIKKANEVDEVAKEKDIVFHSASYGMSGREQLNKALIEEVNVQGTQNIIEACCKHKIQHLVYTSTYNVIFGGQVIRNGDESLPYFPLSEHPDHYSRTKSIAEQIVLNANGLALDDGKTLRTCALRPAGIYGEGEQRHLPRIVSYIERGLFAFTYAQDDGLVDFVHVDNLVQAHTRAGRALIGSQPLASGEAYFISDGKPVNNFEFFRPLVEGLGYKYPSIKIPLSLIYALAFITEIVHSVVGRYVYNFQPLLTRTEVYKTGVTHYFSIQKAQEHFGYAPESHDMSGVVKYFRDRGHGRRESSSITYHLVNVILGLVFACLLLSLLPTVQTTLESRSHSPPF